jgi:hypothetical protein
MKAMLFALMLLTIRGSALNFLFEGDSLTSGGIYPFNVS